MLVANTLSIVNLYIMTIIKAVDTPFSEGASFLVPFTQLYHIRQQSYKVNLLPSGTHLNQIL